MVGRTTLQTAILPAAIVAVAATQTLGQWVQQSYELEAGWNSVFLEVDPEPSDADLLFAGQPIEIVWRRMGVTLRSRASASADVGSSDWRVWLPPSNPDSAVNTLRVIRGGHVYLIRATGSATLTITGRPSGAATQWRQGPNLVGLHVVEDPDGTPTFSDYLSASPIHSALTSCVGGAQPGVLCSDEAACAGESGVCSGSFCTGGAQPGTSCSVDEDCDDIPNGMCQLVAPTRVFETQSDGSLSEIADVQTARVTPGRGFWVTADADGTYDGPIAIDESALGGLEFGKRSARAQVKFENLSDSQRLLTLTYSSSASVPAQPADLPSLAGNTPLLWLERVEGPIEEAFQWQALTQVSFPLDGAGGLGLGARQAIQFSVRRAGLAPATVDVHGHGSQYQSIVTIADEELGFRRHIGVTTEVEGPTAAVLASRGGDQGGDALPALPGLYVGRASVNRVAWVAAGARQVADRGFPESGEDDLRCHGGPLDGEGCVDDLDCAAHGTCLGGAEPGWNCVEDGDCFGEAGVCEDSVCVAGAELGKPCGEQVGCESIAAGVCEKSEADGACGSAFSDTDIPGVCHGGVNDGNACINQSDCPGDAGLCSESVCEGGTEPGSQCTEDTDCEDVADGICGPLPDDATTPRATASAFSFPILAHLSDSGDFKMLTQATLLFAPGDPENPDDAGHYVLATPACDPEIRDPLEGGSIIDGRPFARRISTAAFAFDGDLPLELEASGLSGSVIMPEDHRLNPFRHKFHPDHDSFDKFGDFQAGESYAFTRELTFTFEAEPPPGETTADWGYEIFGGVYEETIEGIHREPIRVDGRFKVHRISEIGQLNDGQGGGK